MIVTGNFVATKPHTVSYYDVQKMEQVQFVCAATLPHKLWDCRQETG